VVVLGGYHDIGIGPASFLPKLRGAVRDDRIVSVTYFFSGSFDDCRREVIEAVEKEFPCGDPNETIEVDVIGLSMGGIVARHAALERPGEKRLRIKRLFTISSPHRGAVRATLPTVHKLHRDLRSGSDFLRELDAAEGGRRDYEIIPYVRLGDWIVGPENAAPRDMPAAYWVPNPPLNSAHWGAPLDPRIVADIARRLRGEQPFTTTTPTKLPSL
jgi:pimeloyl-ACP methyl ester carboxylesterase